MPKKGFSLLLLLIWLLSVASISSASVSSISGNGYTFPETPAYKAIFSMDVNKDGANPPSGLVKYYYSKTRMNMVSTAITDLTISVVGTTGTITGTCTVNNVAGYTFSMTIADSSPDSIQVVIKKSDGSNYYSPGKKNLSGGNLIVTETIVSPNTAPVISPVTNPVLDEGTIRDISVLATDAESDKITLSVSSLPVFASFTDNGNGTGKLSISPDFTQAGIYNINLTAADSKGVSSSAAITLTVNNVNRPPVFSAVGDKNIAEGEVLSFDVSASDPDGDPLSLMLLSVSPQVTFTGFVDHGDGRGTLTFSPDFSSAGNYRITFSVTDGKLAGTLDAGVTVTNVNRPPHFTSFPIVTAGEDRLYTYQPVVDDPDQDILTSVILKAPDGMTIDAATGLIKWTPSLLQIGRQEVQVQVSDSSGATDTQAFFIDVVATVDRAAPVVTLTCPSKVQTSTAIAIEAQATDNVGVAQVSFYIDGLHIKDSTSPPHRITYNAPDEAGGVLHIRVTATDAAGNSGEASAAVSVMAEQDTTPPVIRGLYLPSSAAPGDTVMVGADVTDDRGVAEVRFSSQGRLVNSDRAPPYETGFNIPADASVNTPILIDVEAVDVGGNTLSAQGSIMVGGTTDREAPSSVTIQAPAESQAGRTVQLSASAVDNAGIFKVIFFADGVQIAEDTTPPYQLSYNIPEGRVIGSRIPFSAKAIDFSSNSRDSSTAYTSIIALQEGFIVGEVYNDSTGLPVEGAVVRVTYDKNEEPGGPRGGPLREYTDNRGHYSFRMTEGPAFLEIINTGFTTSYRSEVVQPVAVTNIIDARITPLGSSSSINRLTGGNIIMDDNRISLYVPPGAFSDDIAITLNKLSGQGLPALLPAGWAPVQVAHIGPEGWVPNTSLELTIRGTGELCSSVTFPPSPCRMIAVRWDTDSRSWIRIGTEALSGDGGVLLHLQVMGTVAIVRADVYPSSPQIPDIGTALTGVALQAIPAGVTAEILPSPKILFMQPGARSGVWAALNNTEPLQSGTRIEVDFNESYQRKDNTRLSPAAMTQDFILYQSTSGLEGRFAVSPSEIFDPMLLQEGVIILTAHRPDGTEGTGIIGPSGGSVTSPDGLTLTLPPGAVSTATPVSIASITAPEHGLEGDARFVLMTGVEINLNKTKLYSSAELAISVTELVDANAQILVVRPVQAEGVTQYELVGVAAINGNTLTIGDSQTGLPFPGIVEGGRYYFVRLTVPAGFITGSVESSGKPVSNGIVSSDGLPFVDYEETSEPLFVLASPTVTAAVTGKDLTNGNSATGTVTISEKYQIVTLNLNLSISRPAVVSVSPSDGAAGVQKTASITVRFSRPMDASTVNEASFILRNGTTGVEGTVTLLPDRTTAIFRPASILADSALYHVSLSTAVKDSFGQLLYGNQPDGSSEFHFTTIDTTPPRRPEAGQITVSPPENGAVTISGTQGTLDPGTTVTVKNTGTGITTSVITSDDGSFSIALNAGLKDNIVLIFKDGAGNETTMDMGRAPAPEGYKLVGGTGGIVEGQGSIAALIPAGVLPEDTVVSITPADISGIPQPFTPEMEGYIAGAVKYTMEGVEIEDVMEMTFSINGYTRYTVVDRIPLFEINQDIVLPSDVTPGTLLKLHVTGVDKFRQSAELEVELPIVFANPDTTPRTIVTHTTPVLKLTLPGQAMPGQTIHIIAKAEPPDIKLRIPAPQGLTGEEQFILYSIQNIGGKYYYALADTANLRTLNDGRQVIESNSPPYRGVRRYNDALAFAVYKHLSISFEQAVIKVMQGSNFTKMASFTWDLFKISNDITLADTLLRSYGRQRPPVVTPYEFAVIPVPGGLPTTINVMDLDTNDIIYKASIPAIPAGRLSSVIVIGEDDDNDPMVTSTTSFANHAVPVDAGISISFSHSMDTATLNSANLYIQDENRNRIDSTILLPDDGSGVYVVTVKPNSLLQPGKTYTLIATSGIQRVSGQAIERYEMTFVTGSASQIGFISIPDARSLDVLGDVALVAVNSSSGTANGFRTIDLSDPASPTILGTVDLDPAYNGPVRGIKGLRYKDGRKFAILSHGAKHTTFSKIQVYSIDDPAVPVRLAQKSVGLSVEMLVTCSANGIIDTGNMDDIQVVDFCKSSVLKGIPAVPTVPTVIDTDGKQNVYFINNGVGLMTIDLERLLANQDSFGPSYLPSDKTGRLVVIKDPLLIQDDGHLKFTSPASDPFKASASPVTITGNIQDDNIATILINGFKAIIQSNPSGGSRTFNVALPIHEGYNKIFANAYGAGGGKLGSISIQIILNLSVNPLAGPGTAQMTNPTDYISTNDSNTMDVSASVTDRVKFDKIHINGQLASQKQCPFTEIHPEWHDCNWSGGNGDSINLTLNPGLNSLVATAIDVDEFDPPMLGYSDMRVMEGMTLAIPVTTGTLDIFDTSSLTLMKSLSVSATNGGGMRVSGAVRVMTDIDDDGRTGLMENDDTNDIVTSKTDIDGDGKITVLDELKNLALVGHGTEGKLTFVDITEPHKAVVLGYIEGLGAAYRAWVDSESGIAWLAAGSSVKMIDITHPAHDGLWDKNNDGKDDRILNSIPVSGEAVDIQVDKKKGLIYVLLRGSGVAILNTCCQDIGVDATRIPLPREVRSSTLAKERGDLLYFINTAMTQINDCSSRFSLTGGGGATTKAALLAQGSSACIWRSDEQCSSAYQPGISDYDFEFLAPDNMRSAALKCTEKIEECMGQKIDKCHDSNRAVFDDVSVFFVPENEFSNAYRSVTPVNGKCGSGADPYADLCLGRNGNMVKWILEGEWVKDGSTVYNNGTDLENVLNTLRSPMRPDDPSTPVNEDPIGIFNNQNPGFVEPSHIPRLEGWEWACLEDFALNYSGARIRILGDGVGDVPINNPKFLTAVHKAAKAGIRAVFGKLLASDAGNALMLESTREDYNSDTGCYTAYSGTGAPASISNNFSFKRCESFEEYVASKAILSVVRGLGILTEDEALLAHEMYRRKADVGAQITTEADANRFISDTMGFIANVRSDTSVNSIYNTTIRYYNDKSTREGNYNKCDQTNVPDYQPGGDKLKLKIPVRAYNNSYLKSSEIPLKFNHNGSEVKSITEESLAPGESKYFEKDENGDWIFVIKPDANGTHSVQFMVDPDDEFSESDKSNNYDGFYYYMLYQGNTTPPLVPNGDYRPAKPANIPAPPASDACLDPNGNAPPSPALQLITTVNGQYEVSAEGGTNVQLKATVRNIGNKDVKNIKVEDPRVGLIGTISSLTAGSSSDVSISYPVPSEEGLHLLIVTAHGEINVSGTMVGTGVVSSYVKINVPKQGGGEGAPVIRILSPPGSVNAQNPSDLRPFQTSADSVTVSGVIDSDRDISEVTVNGVTANITGTAPLFRFVTTSPVPLAAPPPSHNEIVAHVVDINGVSDDDRVWVDRVPSSGLRIIKLADGLSVLTAKPGDTVTYTVSVINDGIDVIDITLIDLLDQELNLNFHPEPFDLASGGRRDFTYTYTIPNDAQPGEIVNMVLAQGIDGNGDVVGPVTASATVQVGDANGSLILRPRLLLLPQNPSKVQLNVIRTKDGADVTETSKGTRYKAMLPDSVSQLPAVILEGIKLILGRIKDDQGNPVYPDAQNLSIGSIPIASIQVDAQGKLTATGNGFNVLQALHKSEGSNNLEIESNYSLVIVGNRLTGIEIEPHSLLTSTASAALSAFDSILKDDLENTPANGTDVDSNRNLPMILTNAGPLPCSYAPVRWATDWIGKSGYAELVSIKMDFLGGSVGAVDVLAGARGILGLIPSTTVAGIPIPVGRLLGTLLNFGATQAVDFTIDNPNVATVRNSFPSGIVSAQNPGVAKITGTLTIDGYGSAKDDLIVVVGPELRSTEVRHDPTDISGPGASAPAHVFAKAGMSQLSGGALTSIPIPVADIANYVKPGAGEVVRYLNKIIPGGVPPNYPIGGPFTLTVIPDNQGNAMSLNINLQLTTAELQILGFELGFKTPDFMNNYDAPYGIDDGTIAMLDSSLFSSYGFSRNVRGLHSGITHLSVETCVPFIGRAEDLYDPASTAPDPGGAKITVTCHDDDNDGYTTCDGDCDDNNPAVHPGASEICNGVDDNCNGSVDEGVAGLGSSCSAGTGACSATGVMVCDANQTGTVCSAVAGTPGTELCNGIDDDCNGTVDDGIADIITGTNVGACRTEIQSCVNGTMSIVQSAIVPLPEVCNGIDDNCNGQIDEGVQNTYYHDADGDGYGNVLDTIQACTPPANYVTDSSDCNDSNAAINPGAAEVCDGIDNDCNGTPDYVGSCDDGDPNTLFDTCGNNEVCAGVQVALLIDEIVTDPKSDWSDNSGTPFNATPGSGVIDSGDEYIEIRNISTIPLRVRDMIVRMTDSTPEDYVIGSGGGTVEVYSAGSNADSLLPGGILVIGNPPGEMDNNIFIEVLFVGGIHPVFPGVQLAHVKIGGADGAPGAASTGPSDEAIRRRYWTGYDTTDFNRGAGDPGVLTGP